MRVHLLAPPQTQTTKAYSLDGFTIATIRFARILKSIGAHVMLYASEENEAPCDELIPILSKAEQKRFLNGGEYQHAGRDNNIRLWKEANKRTIVQMKRRKHPRDFICTIGGLAQKEIADAYPGLMCVEYSIGYDGCFAPFRVYQSYAWRNYMHGRQGMPDGRFWDEVIPYFFDPDEYTFRNEKEPFALYVGRLTAKKGLSIACEAAKKAGMPLKVIGHGSRSLITHDAEYLGALPDDERNDYMSRATCLIAPTRYLEPFGSVAIEAQLCGTPVISTDFGAFTETVQHGITGFRCTYLGEFVRGIRESAGLNHALIRNRAKALYSLNVAAPKYNIYLNRLNLLWSKGWESMP